MPTIANKWLSRDVRQSLRISMLCVLLAGTAYGQANPTKPDALPNEINAANVSNAISKVKSGDFLAVDVDLIARAGAIEAIPVMKEQFTRVQDTLLRAKIAATLVRLGDKDDVYWNFLVNLARPAIESKAPDFITYDKEGKSLPGPSPEFEAWAKTQNLSPTELGEEYIYLLPGGIAFLGWSRDPRAIPLLRQALLSPNYQIEIVAALGLAEIGNKDSIPLIVKACSKAPRDAAAAIAQALVYFDDPAAQNAVDQYIPPETAKIYRDARANGKKTPWTVY